jgi:hypothetical protein
MPRPDTHRSFKVKASKKAAELLPDSSVVTRCWKEDRMPTGVPVKPLQAQVPGIPRKIIDYHLDECSDWVADLECGHQQHVRHDPPWTIRHWVTTPQGRLEHIGVQAVYPSSTCSRHVSIQPVAGELLFRSAAGHVTLLHSVAGLARIELVVADFRCIRAG